MSFPIRPSTPRPSEDSTIHRSKSYYDRVSPLCTFITCLSDDTVVKLLKNAEEEYRELDSLDAPIGDDKDGTTNEQYIAARRWLREHEIVSQDEFIKKVREKQFGHVLGLPKRK